MPSVDSGLHLGKVADFLPLTTSVDHEHDVTLEDLLPDLTDEHFADLRQSDFDFWAASLEDSAEVSYSSA